jgi:hypothetical protein
MLTLSELLTNRGLPLDLSKKRIKMMRHEDGTLDVPLAEFSDRHFQEYQSYQQHRRLECDWLVSFVGWPRRQARFKGVFKVGRRLEPGDRPLSDDFPCQGPAVSIMRRCHFYELERVSCFEDLEGRLIIDWPGIGQAYHLWYVDCPIVEVLPQDYGEQFPGIQELLITYSKLRRMVSEPHAFREWKQHLSSVGGVYLITDDQGFQYVGSATGRNGIWGRWSNYAADPTGGNVALQKLLGIRPDAYRNFKFSVLRSFDIDTPRNEAIRMEERVKEKLGRRAIVLDSSDR